MDEMLISGQANPVRVWINNRELNPERSRLVFNHSTEFSWGYEGSGPAAGDPGGEFTPGQYLAPGYVITSRGCPNKCWYCRVPKTEGTIRELEIKQGNKIQDGNLLACSKAHITRVFQMLQGQREIEFTGGLDAARLEDWHIDWLTRLKPRQIFLAYDKPGDWGPFCNAVRRLFDAGFYRQRLRCYVLIGYPGDKMHEANSRLEAVAFLGVYPFAMLYRDAAGKARAGWRRLQEMWIRPANIYRMLGAKNEGQRIN